MSYRYEFDDTRDGDLRLRRSQIRNPSGRLPRASRRARGLEPSRHRTRRLDAALRAGGRRPRQHARMGRQTARPRRGQRDRGERSLCRKLALRQGRADPGDPPAAGGPRGRNRGRAGPMPPSARPTRASIASERSRTSSTANRATSSGSSSRSPKHPCEPHARTLRPGTGMSSSATQARTRKALVRPLAADPPRARPLGLVRRAHAHRGRQPAPLHRPSVLHAPGSASS